LLFSTALGRGTATAAATATAALTGAKLEGVLSGFRRLRHF
jgi:hypothetical protein